MHPDTGQHGRKKGTREEDYLTVSVLFTTRQKGHTTLCEMCNGVFFLEKTMESPS